MTRISPKNVALASIAVLIIGIIANATICAVIPSVPLLREAVALTAVIGCCGLLFAYYYAAVNLWDAGNQAGAALFLAVPMLVHMGLTALPATPLAQFAGVCAGGLVFAAVMVGLGCWTKRQIKRYLLRMDSTTRPALPGYPLMILCAVAMTLAVVAVIPSAGSEYPYSTVDTPRDQYAQHGISFTYPQEYQVFDRLTFKDDPAFVNTYREGMVILQDAGEHESITVIWTDAGSLPPSLSKTIDLLVQDMDRDPAVRNLVVGAEASRSVGQSPRHIATCIPVAYDLATSGQSPGDLTPWVGYIGCWHCGSTGRLIAFILETQGGTDVADGMLDAFLASARCH